MLNIHVVNSLGSISLTPYSRCLSAGFKTEYVANSGSRTLKVDCQEPNGFKQNWYNGILECAENHAASTLDNAGYPVSVDFTQSDPSDDNGYYISRINGIEGCKGAFNIVGGPTFRWALASEGITIADMARPELDCLDYMRLAGYVTRLEEVLNKLATDISGTPAGVMSQNAVYGLYKQYQAVREIWNYLVIKGMVIFDVKHQGNKLYVKAMFTNGLAGATNVGMLTMGFRNGTYKAMFEEAYSLDDSGTKTTWTTSSSILQPMSTGSWQVSPPSTISIDAGKRLEVTMVFLVVGQGTVPMAQCGKTVKTVAPWLDKLPVMSNSKVVSAGYLSWERPHFNPSSYPLPVPANLPPAGDGCTYKRSPGIVTFSWADVSNVASDRPSLHVRVVATADKTTASFTTDFSTALSTSRTDTHGTFSLSTAAQTVTIRWTPTGGSAVDIATITMTDRHFHEGDTITLDIPDGWGATTDLEAIGVSCVWSIQQTNLIEGTPTAGGRHIALLEKQPAVSSNATILPARLNDHSYFIDSIRTPPSEG